MIIKNYINIIKNLKSNHLFDPMNILRILGMSIRSKAIVGPLKVTIDITNLCDMGCTMCWYHSPNLPEKENKINEFPLEMFAELVKKLKNLHTKTIMLTGEGEPFTHPNIIEMIKIARKNSFDIEIMTNAYYLDEDKIKFLIKIGVAKINVSLHCVNKKSFHKIRPLRNSDDFEKIVQNLYAFKKLRNKVPLLYITNVITSLNFQDVEKFSTLAKDLNADKIFFKPYIPMDGLETKLMPSADEKKIFVNSLRMAASRLAIPNNITDFISLSEYDQKINHSPLNSWCYIPWAHSAISVNGDVLGCVYAQSKPLGNIFKSPFNDIWNNEKYRLFRKGVFCRKGCLGKTVYPLLF